MSNTQDAYTDRPILYSYFVRKAKELLAQYETSKEQNSSEDIGANREYFCNYFLKRALPPSMKVIKAQIMDSKGNRSGQIDTVIIRDDCPIFPIGESDNVPVESVFGVVEIKSNLTRAKLKEAINTLKKIKILDVNLGQATMTFFNGAIIDRPIRFIFAYEGAMFSTLRDELNVPENRDIVDFICILKRGAIMKNGFIFKWDNENDYGEVSGKGASLGFFYHHMMTFATSFMGRSVNLDPYFEPFEKWSENDE